MSYKEDIYIDKFALDEEWLRHPGKYHRYAKKLAKAKQEKDQSKKDVLVVRAKAALSIRKNPTAHGFDKLTDKVVEALVTTDKTVIKAEQLSVDKAYKAEILQVAVTAFDHRKKALEDLVRLHLSGYFAQPSIEHESKQQLDSKAVIKADRKRKKEGCIK